MTLTQPSNGGGEDWKNTVVNLLIAYKKTSSTEEHFDIYHKMVRLVREQQDAARVEGQIEQLRQLVMTGYIPDEIAVSCRLELEAQLKRKVMSKNQTDTVPPYNPGTTDGERLDTDVDKTLQDSNFQPLSANPPTPTKDEIAELRKQVQKALMPYGGCWQFENGHCGYCASDNDYSEETGDPCYVDICCDHREMLDKLVVLIKERKNAARLDELDALRKHWIHIPSANKMDTDELLLEVIGSIGTYVDGRRAEIKRNQEEDDE